MRQTILKLFFTLTTCFGFAQIPTNGLIKDYKFTNGSLTSDTNPLLNSGTPTLVPTGSNRTIINDRNNETSKAINLNGDSFSAGGTNASSVNNYSISFWVKTTTNESPKRYIFDQHNTAANPAGYSISLKDGKIYFNGQISWNFASSGNNSGVRQVISAPINDGQWHHVVCTLSSSSSAMLAGSLIQYTLTYTYKMYVDNVYIGSDAETNYASGPASDPYSVRAITPTKLLVIGKSPDAMHLDYQDGLDQIRYYETTLTVQDIDQLYMEDKPLVPIYVNVNAIGANNGTTWADAYTNLETALTNYNSSKQIWVAAGTYKPNGTARTSTFNLPSNLKMYGGFNGTETTKEQRNYKTNLTVLSGDLSGNDNTNIVASETTRQDNCYHVITIRGNAKEIIVDGFTIKDGNANGPTLTTGTASAQFYHTRGGAIYVNTYAANDDSKCTFKNCIIEKNAGSSAGVFSAYFAGGVNNQTYDANFISCTIKNNYSGGLGAMLYSGANAYSWYAKGKMINCLFHNNTNTSGASCVYLGASTTGGGTMLGLDQSIINCTFTSNTGTSGYVITGDNADNSKLYNSIIYGNGSLTPLNYVNGLPISGNNNLEGNQLITNNNNSNNPNLDSNFKLPALSPAINSGENSYFPTEIVTDLDGNNRFIGIIDRGAFEYDATLHSENFDSTKIVSVYPNPTIGNIQIDTQEAIKSVKLFTLEGKQILETQNKTLQIYNLNAGVYLLSIEFENGTNSFHKVIKQ